MFAVVAILEQFQSIRESIVSNLLTEDRWEMMVDGLGVTLEISLLSILFATLFGALICSLRMSRNRAVKGTAQLYIGLYYFCKYSNCLLIKADLHQIAKDL